MQDFDFSDAETRLKTAGISFELDGYFARFARAGIRPDYSEPVSFLPEATGAKMRIVTAYMVARRLNLSAANRSAPK